MDSSLLSLLWWVAIGVLFFWVMSRGGCGMMGHGRGRGADHERTNGHAKRAGKPIDPVCGMEVDPATAAGTRVVAGDTYFFCSQTCLEAFAREPRMYARARESHRDREEHRHAGC